MSVRILIGDAREKLAELADESVHCCVTSPPYFGLRDYGVDGQIGLEASPEAYVQELVGVFREVRRVLRRDATVWLNLGDSYSSGGRDTYGSFKPDTKQATQAAIKSARRPAQPDGIKPKDLLGIPWRVAFALQADGWWLRSDIIWHKPNPMPESVTDRPTSAHEHVFLLAKSERYYFDQSAVAEVAIMPAGSKAGYAGYSARAEAMGRAASGNEKAGAVALNDGTRNIRNVWTIATEPFPEAHFATFPPSLIEPCIKAGTSERGCCGRCGAHYARRIEIESRPNFRGDGQKHDGTYYRPNPGGGVSNDARARIDRGWALPCDCFVDAVPCTVLDPFGGAGTTGLVADRLKRNAILIELNPAYAEMARRRIQGDGGMFAAVSLDEATGARAEARMNMPAGLGAVEHPDTVSS